MSAENVKQEPVDLGYERSTENIAVKKEPSGNDSDEDLTWMNEDLAFLNEIDLVSDDSQPSNADQWNEHSKSDATSSYAGSERADTPGSRGGRKRKRNRKKRSTETEATTATPVYEPVPLKIELEQVIQAIKSNKGSLEVEQALKHIQRTKELENRISSEASTSQAGTAPQNESTFDNSAFLSVSTNMTKELNELLAHKTKKSSLVDVTATSPCSPASLYNILAANNFQVVDQTLEQQPRSKKKRIESVYTTEMLRYEIARAVVDVRRKLGNASTDSSPTTATAVPAPVQIKQDIPFLSPATEEAVENTGRMENFEGKVAANTTPTAAAQVPAPVQIKQEKDTPEIDKAAENTRRMKELEGKAATNTTPTAAVQVPAPVKIKQEKLTPPREIPEKQLNEPVSAATADPDFTSRRIKEERTSPSREAMTRNGGPISNRRQSAQVVSVNYQSSISDDAAKHREQVLNRDLPSISTMSLSVDLPASIRIKSEPVDKNDLPKATSTIDRPVDKQQLVKKPVSLKLMPEPMRIKEEPVDYGESSRDRIIIPSKRVEAEKLDDKLMPHRQRVIKFIKETIKNFDLFENNTKLQRRFLFTPTFILCENKEDISKNRSPLKNSNNIKYEFSTPLNKIDTLKFGVEKLSENSAKICSLLGFNAYDLSRDSQNSKLANVDAEDETSQSTDLSAFFVNVACQTGNLTCNNCVERKLRRFTDRETQTHDAGSTSSSSSPLYDGISHATLQVLSQMTSAQQTAIKEFADLLRGPSPTSTNDVMHMREKLMDIFTLAQSQATNTNNSAIDPLNIRRRPATRFDQPDRPASSVHQPLFPSTASSPILNNDYQSQQPTANSAYISPAPVQSLFPSTTSAPIQAPLPHRHPLPTNNVYPPAPVPYPQHNQGYMHPIQNNLPNPYAQHRLPALFSYRPHPPAMLPGNPYRFRNPHDPRNVNVQLHPRQQ